MSNDVQLLQILHDLCGEDQEQVKNSAEQLCQIDDELLLHLAKESIQNRLAYPSSLCIDQYIPPHAATITAVIVRALSTQIH